MKSDYYIDRVSKSEAAELLLRFHYLKDISKTFKSGYNYGLYKNNDFCPLNIGGIQGVCIFTGLPVPEIAKGAFGLERHEQMDYSNYHDSASTRLHSRASIISLLGSYQKRLDALEKRPTLGGLSHTLIVITMLVQFIVLVTLGTVVYQNQKKIFILQTERNIPEVVLEDPKVNGETDLASTDM